MGNNSRILISRPHYLEPYSFELYDYKSWYSWMEDNWQISIYLAAAYLILIFAGQRWMSQREAFSLRKPLLLWNIALSLGSLFMFFRMKPEAVENIRSHGLYNSLCNRDNHTVISSFWVLMFTGSKILEFGDTAFIVLRKQKLIFLHYYHHITVAMYTFYTFRQFDPAGRYFGPMNSLIHFLMYGYYSIKALNVKVPRSLAKTITVLQIVQMFIGLWVGVVSLVGKVLWDDCDRPWDNILWGLGMYSSYAILFIHFFSKSYSKKLDNIKTQ